MQNSLFQAICRMGIFMICVRAIIHFRPQEVYEKYLRLLAGIMVMIQLLLPVGKFILGKGGQEAAEILQQFKQELEQGMEEAVENAAAADAILEQMTLEEVQRSLGGQDLQEKQREEEGQDLQEKKQAAEEQDGSISKEGSTSKENGTDERKTAGTEDGIVVSIEAIEPISIGSLQPEE